MERPTSPSAFVWTPSRVIPSQAYAPGFHQPPPPQQHVGSYREFLLSRYEYSHSSQVPWCSPQLPANPLPSSLDSEESWQPRIVELHDDPSPMHSVSPQAQSRMLRDPRGGESLFGRGAATHPSSSHETGATWHEPDQAIFHDVSTAGATTVPAPLTGHADDEAHVQRLSPLGPTTTSSEHPSGPASDLDMVDHDMATESGMDDQSSSGFSVDDQIETGYSLGSHPALLSAQAICRAASQRWLNDFRVGQHHVDPRIRIIAGHPTNSILDNTSEVCSAIWAAVRGSAAELDGADLMTELIILAEELVFWYDRGAAQMCSVDALAWVTDVAREYCEVLGDREAAAYVARVGIYESGDGI